MVYDLRASFDGHNFVSERGHKYQCSVVYAPYQKGPKVSTKKDPREGTLEKGKSLLYPQHIVVVNPFTRILLSCSPLNS